MIKILPLVALIFLVPPFVYAVGYGSDIYGDGIYGAADEDGDGIEDSSDNVLFNETNVTSSGLTNLSITIGGSPVNEQHSGNKRVLFFDQGEVIVNFTHNFNQTNILDLSKVEIQKTSTYLIVNFSGQLKGNKTLYLDDNSFINLCVKDAEIALISEVSSGCNGDSETDFTTCLGSSTEVTLDGITCTDEGSRIVIENLQFSAIRGATSDSSTSGSGRVGGGGGGVPLPTPVSIPVKKVPLVAYECSQTSDCGEKQYCFENKCQKLECSDDSVCNVGEGETCWNFRCVKLFDMEILNFESPVKMGSFFNFTYFLKAVAEINGDVEINFWIEQAGRIITSGQDTIYFGSFEEKTKTKKLFLPNNVSSGTYIFNIEVTHGTYTASAYRTIGIIVDGDSATIVSISEKNYSIYLILGLFGLAILITFLLFNVKWSNIIARVMRKETLNEGQIKNVLERYMLEKENILKRYMLEKERLEKEMLEEVGLGKDNIQTNELRDFELQAFNIPSLPP